MNFASVINAFTLSAVCPTTIQISAETERAACSTCSMSVRPPTRWRTFAYLDFMRVLLPAARIRTRRFSMRLPLHGVIRGQTPNYPTGLPFQTQPAQADPDRDGSFRLQPANRVPLNSSLTSVGGRDRS